MGKVDSVFADRVAAALPRDAAICVGFSGGLDSVVLVELFAQAARSGKMRLAALHVHHGLSPHAGEWADFCRAFCLERSIDLTVEYVRLDRAAPEGLEAAARAARYALFAARAEPFVALAHHLDDQAETLLLQLLRGSGLKGVAAMPELRSLPGSLVKLFRPLLALTRSEILDYAQGAGLRWVEDESNLSRRHDRNLIRHDLTPLLAARFPAWRETLSRFARHAASAGELLDELAHLDGVPREPGQALAVLPELSQPRRANALRAFLALNALAMPSEARLSEMARQIFGARADARVRIEHDEVAIVRYRDRVHLERSLASCGAWRVAWHGEEALDLGAGRGSVRFERVKGEGLAESPTRAGPWYFASRGGGERIRLESRRPTRTLKNLLQEHAVPAWRRGQLPLLFHGESLVWVPGIGIAADHACEAGAEGLKPSWTPASG